MMMIYDDNNDNGLQEPSPGAGVRHHRDAPHEAHSAADDVWQTHREETHLLLPRRGKLSQLSYKLSLTKLERYTLYATSLIIELYIVFIESQ